MDKDIHIRGAVSPHKYSSTSLQCGRDEFLAQVEHWTWASLLCVLVVYEKYTGLARALKEVRVGFILIGSSSIFSLLTIFITTISAWTETKCKNGDNGPHAKSFGHWPSPGGAVRRRRALYSFGWHLASGWLCSSCLCSTSAHPTHSQCRC
ncbi:hypothetical protein K503DRAFT_367886 [Rhizopogon vinicolor AM-OR11-026]|uniref:Uncharacterized protein n=1 Tax=Rhizopogon vinicolor AM-OR11-026 TaxID=1314800 RepID=A0A1B7MS64_9AGAM|nr:hypothetical protein K503DRAFT_367886 [Rhizopogon vinicolor AM-OR11-026]